MILQAQPGVCIVLAKLTKAERMVAVFTVAGGVFGGWRFAASPAAATFFKHKKRQNIRSKIEITTCKGLMLTKNAPSNPKPTLSKCSKETYNKMSKGLMRDRPSHHSRRFIKRSLGKRQGLFE